MRLLPRMPVRMLVMDVVAILIAIALPWSTSAVSILVAFWVVLLPLTVNLSELFATIKRPFCILSLLFLGLAITGMLWSQASWAVSIRGVSPVTKFLVLPLLVYHFEYSKRGLWVFLAFFVSSALLMLLSWVVVFEPQWMLKPNVNRGLPIKNYIDQSQEFALCAIGATWPAFKLLREKRYAIAFLLLGLSLAFLFNLIFVLIARTAFIYLPILFLISAYYCFDRRPAIIVAVVAIFSFAMVGLASPSLRSKAATIFFEYDQYRNEQTETSVGQRLEFWRKSLGFIGQAPWVGHGTGSGQVLFEHATPVPRQDTAQTIWNPHNQTLNVGIQWGLLGCSVLYAMWIVHFSTFCRRQLAAWIGILVVTQNIIGSLFNSHLFDFTEGWIYVLGVGVAGGMLHQGLRKPSSSTQARDSALSEGTSRHSCERGFRR